MIDTSPERQLADEGTYLSRAREGDARAWDQIVREHGDALFRFAYLMLGDADDAEDVVQEAFVRAYRSLARFEMGRALRPWLLTIVSNLANNRRRSVRRYIAAVQRFVLAGVETTGRLEERTSEEWEAHTLWQAVRTLKPPEQEVIYMRFFLDLSEAEMASALQIPPGTVKSRLHRALGKLRSVVDQEFPMLREERVR
jgi:RNA polymerase sigma-70 factor, ECF subfamily